MSRARTARGWRGAAPTVVVSLEGANLTESELRAGDPEAAATRREARGAAPVGARPASNRELSSALARRSHRQAYRGRTAPFELMAALPIDPAGPWGVVVRAAASRRRFFPPFVRTASRPSTFSTTFKGTCSKCVWAFCWAPLVLTIEEEYPRRSDTGHLVWDASFRLARS